MDGCMNKKEKTELKNWVEKTEVKKRKEKRS